MKRWMVLFLVGVVSAGCLKQFKSGKEADVREVFSAADACVSAGKTNDALLILTEAMKDKAYARDRGWLFTCKLSIMLTAGQEEAVKTLYLETVGKDEALTRSGFGMLYNYYQTRDNVDAAEAWCKTLTEIALPADLASQAFTWYINIAQKKGPFDRVVALAEVGLKKFDAATSRRILSSVVASELGSERYENANRILDAISSTGGKAPELVNYVTVTKVEMLFQQGKWDEGAKQFEQVAPALPDGELSGLFSRVVARCREKAKLDVADGLIEFVLKSIKDKSGVQRAAAVQYIEVAKERKNMALLSQRLEQMKGMAVPEPILFSLYRNEFYTIMQEGKKENILAMVAFGNKLMPVLTKEDDLSQAKSMALDGAFVTDDYALSLKLLEQGIPGRDKVWHDMAINKAKAHLALQSGNKKEAVEYFRKFMDSVGTWDKPEQDPITGVLYSKEMCLGRNAKRIGDILASIPDAAGAAKAYEESKAYFVKAKADVKTGSKEMEVIDADMAEIGKPPKAL